MVVKNLVLLSLPMIAIATPVWGQASQRQLCSDEHLARALGHGEIVMDCTITVTGNLPASLSESSGSIIKLEPDQTRAENTLRDVPGLQQFRRSDARSANPTSQGVTLRGLGGNASSRAVLILDDVPQADPFGGWISWPGYDALNLASIRVRKGAGQVSSGPGALAGVIELDSLQNQDRIGGRLAFGSRDSVDTKASLLQPLGDGSVSVSGSYARGDGFIPIIKGQRGSVDRGAAYEQAGIALRGVATLGGSTELQANARVFTDERDRGFDFSDNHNNGVDASLRVVNRNPDRMQWSALAYVQIREFQTRFGSVADDRNSVNLVLDQFAVPSTGLGARFELRPIVSDNAELRIGGDWRRTIGKTRENFFFAGLIPGRSRNAGGRTDTLGGFVEASLKPSYALTLTAGGRADHWAIANGFRKEINIGGSVRSDELFANRSGWEGTGRVGFAFAASDFLKFRGGAYLGWRLPTLNELYRPFRVGADATAANEMLSPERVKGTELGLDYEHGALSFGATAFLNRLDNAIANVKLGQGPGLFPGVGFVAANGNYRRRENLDAIDSKGFELDASYSINEFTLRAGYAYIDAQVKGTDISGALDGLRPTQVPKHFANARLAFDNGSVRLDTSIRYIGNQFEDDENSSKLSDAVTIDAGIAIPVVQKIRLELRGENLFDTEVQAAISGSGIIERATPRTLWLGIAVEL